MDDQYEANVVPRGRQVPIKDSFPAWQLIVIVIPIKTLHVYSSPLSSAFASAIVILNF